VENVSLVSHPCDEFRDILPKNSSALNRSRVPVIIISESSVLVSTSSSNCKQTALFSMLMPMQLSSAHNPKQTIYQASFVFTRNWTYVEMSTARVSSND
jgi:hypothetical protein